MKKLVLFLAVAALAGCASAPKVLEPKPFDSNHSYAYNIAAQTDLLSDHSPLRDYTPEEAEEGKAKIKEASTPSKMFGLAYVLMGNLTGVIDIAGGGITDMALSNHTSGKERWIVMLPKNQFNKEVEAQNYILSNIKNAANKVLSKFGSLETIENERGTLKHQALVINGKAYGVGLVEPQGINKSLLEANIYFSENSAPVESYTYGTTSDSFFIQNVLITTPLISVANAELGRTLMTQDDLHKAITKELPKGFFIYSPSLPRVKDNGKVYTDTSIQIPAIYTQGEKYEFIK